jgi:hypothetical protein
MDESEQQREALQRFIDSIDKELIQPDANETPVHKRWRVLYTTLTRFDLYCEAGLPPPEDIPNFDEIFESLRQRELDARAAMLEERRRGRQ